MEHGLDLCLKLTVVCEWAWAVSKEDGKWHMIRKAEGSVEAI